MEDRASVGPGEGAWGKLEGLWLGDGRAPAGLPRRAPPETAAENPEFSPTRGRGGRHILLSPAGDPQGLSASL